MSATYAKKLNQLKTLAITLIIANARRKNMIESFVLVVTMTLTGWNGVSQTVTQFSSTDYDNPKVACETIKQKVVEQSLKSNGRIYAECVKIPE